MTIEIRARSQEPGVSWLYYIVRGSIAFGSAAEIESFVRCLHEQKSIHITKAKNRFQKPSLTGYRDICIHFRLEATEGVSHICGLQIHQKALHALDKKMRSPFFYEFFDLTSLVLSVVCKNA